MSEGIVKLRARTKKGSELLKKHGPFWDVEWYNGYCIAFHGPGYFIKSRVDDNERRWIREDGRPHFYANFSRGTGKTQLDQSTDGDSNG